MLPGDDGVELANSVGEMYSGYNDEFSVVVSADVACADDDILLLEPMTSQSVQTLGFSPYMLSVLYTLLRLTNSSYIPNCLKWGATANPWTLRTLQTRKL